IVALEGRPRGGGARGAVRALLPGHAARLLDRLLGGAEPFATLKAWRAALAESRGRPAAVGVAQRAIHLAALIALLTPGLSLMTFVAPLLSAMFMQPPLDGVAYCEVARERVL